MDPPSSFTGLEMKIYIELTRRASFVSSTHHLLHFLLGCTASASLTMLKYLDYVKSGNVNLLLLLSTHSSLIIGGSPLLLSFGGSPPASPASYLAGLLRRRDPSTNPGPKAWWVSVGN